MSTIGGYLPILRF